jgi:hypothetical protein
MPVTDAESIEPHASPLIEGPEIKRLEWFPEAEHRKANGSEKAYQRKTKISSDQTTKNCHDKKN